LTLAQKSKADQEPRPGSRAITRLEPGTLHTEGSAWPTQRKIGERNHRMRKINKARQQPEVFERGTNPDEETKKSDPDLVARNNEGKTNHAATQNLTRTQRLAGKINPARGILLTAHWRCTWAH
jgi:hypothetical protein